jgi:hypothetical protein
MRYMNFTTHSLQIPIRDLLDKLTIGSVKDLEYPNVQLQYMSFNGLGFCTNESLVD